LRPSAAARGLDPLSSVTVPPLGAASNTIGSPVSTGVRPAFTICRMLNTLSAPSPISTTKRD
jgi:hypothetical protein